MADLIYKFRAPDGTILKFRGPPGISEEELQQAAEAQYAAQQRAAPPPAPEPTQEKNLFAEEGQVYDPVSGVPMGYGLGQKTGAALMSGAAGTMKPLAGLAQWLGINKPAQALGQITKTAEQVGGTPAKVADIVGQAASPVPLKMGQAFGRAAPAVGQALERSVLAKSAATGAGSAALAPTEGLEKDYQDFLTQKGKEIGLGAITGGALGKAGQLATNPRVSESMQRLKDMGMTYFTPGQLASQIPLVGPGLRRIESASTSVPLVGAFIERGATKVNEQMNKAVGDRVLAPLGEKVPKNVKAGEELVDYVNSRIESTYDALTPKLSIANVQYKNPTMPSGFTTTVKALNDKAQQVSAGMPSTRGHDLAGMVREEFEKYILNPLLTKGSMTGVEFREAEKNLGRTALAYLQNPEYRRVGEALRELQAELRRELSYQNPQYARELRNIHLAFRRHLPMERAASYVGAEDRVFSPAQLESAIRAETRGAGRFARGQGMLYPESQAALDVMGRRMPDSGTAQRIGTAAGLASLPVTYQALLPAAAATASLYNVPVMRGLTALATERPEALRALERPLTSGLSRVGGILGAQ